MLLTCTYILGDIFKTVISIYAQENYKLLPLPTLEEVLICDHNTTVEEVNLMLDVCMFLQGS